MREFQKLYGKKNCLNFIWWKFFILLSTNVRDKQVGVECETIWLHSLALLPRCSIQPRWDKAGARSLEHTPSHPSLRYISRKLEPRPHPDLEAGHCDIGWRLSPLGSPLLDPMSNPGQGKYWDSHSAFLIIYIIHQLSKDFLMYRFLKNTPK